MRLDAFLTQNRADIIQRCRVKVGSRRAPRPTDGEIETGIPLFLDQLIDTLHLQNVKNPDRAGVATRHGRDLMKEGFTVGQVVHDYGDVCQSVTDLAIERGAPIAAEDFRILNRCLDDAIADAVTEFSRLSDISAATESNERLGIFAHEVRNLLASASISYEVLKSGRVGITGATGAVLERSLARMAALVDRQLAEVRLEVGGFRKERIEVCRFLEEIEVTASLTARAKGVMFSVTPPCEAALAVIGDVQILSATVVNLVQNAVKFTKPHGHVAISARATDDRVQIDVADECGGLPPGSHDALFHAFKQQGANRSGLGLGLIVARRGAEAHGGTIDVLDVPGTGCVFTLDLPRAA